MREPGDLETATERAIARSFVADLALAITRRDVQAVTSHWALPCLAVTGGGATSWDSAGSLRLGVQSLLAEFETLGYREAHAEVQAVHSIGPHLLGVSARWQLLDDPKSPSLRGAHRYVLRREGTDWKVRTLTVNHPASAGSATIDPLDPMEIASPFLETYRRAFRTLRPETVAPHWCPPTLALGEAGVQLCSSNAEILAAFRTSLPPLRASGLRDVRPILKAARQVGTSSLELDVHWDLIDRSLVSFKTLQTVYLLRQVGSAWRVAAVYLA